MIENCNKKELEIAKILLDYLKKIEDDNSILKGNLLTEEEKKFIFTDLNAFIIGLIADQSVKAEIAWSLPYKLSQRMGGFDIAEILKKYNQEDLENFIKTKPALHRYPSRMSNYIYNAFLELYKNYNSKAENIWNNKTAAEIVETLETFKGISHKKASLGTLILVRDLGINILDKENIDIAYDIHIRRLFLRLGLVEMDIQEEILKVAQRLYPEFPGKLTTAFWTIGREICRPTDPSCLICPLHNCCDKKLEKTINLK
ncbi:MAG TPA: endonuclease III [Candidatus Faecisoma merdavium]|nr:endonuclease III [Candidatus Faecisoma merdavium]